MESIYSLTSMPTEVCTGGLILVEVDSSCCWAISVSVTASTIVVVMVGSSTASIVSGVAVGLDTELDGACRSIVIGA